MIPDDINTLYPILVRKKDLIYILRSTGEYDKIVYCIEHN